MAQTQETIFANLKKKIESLPEIESELEIMSSELLRSIYLACLFIPDSQIRFKDEKDEVLRNEAITFIKKWHSRGFSALTPYLSEQILLLLAQRSFEIKYSKTLFERTF